MYVHIYVCESNKIQAEPCLCCSLLHKAASAQKAQQDCLTWHKVRPAGACI